MEHVEHTINIQRNSALARIAEAHLSLQEKNPSDPRLNFLSEVTPDSITYHLAALKELVPEPYSPRGIFPVSLALARYHQILTQ